MQNEIKELINKFEEIKKAGFHKSVRKGKYGIGDTFESLLGKEFDKNYFPDYKGIEIKTKFGYTKTPLGLFCLTPSSNYPYTIKYLVDNYGYPESSFSKFNILKAEATCNNDSLVAKKYYFDLMVDRDDKRVILLIKDKNKQVISRDIYWPFDELENRLKTKLNYLALIIGYPYLYKQDYYFKFFKMTIYKLKDFNDFLQLIEEGRIKIVFNIGIYKEKTNYGLIKDRGTAFKLETTDIYRLFDKIN